MHVRVRQRWMSGVNENFSCTWGGCGGCRKKIFAVAWLKKRIILCTKTTRFVTGRKLEMMKVSRPGVWHVCEVHATFDYIVLYFINSNNIRRCLGDGPSPDTMSALSTPSDQIRRHPEAKATGSNEGKINNAVSVLDFFILSLPFSLPPPCFALSIYFCLGYPLKKGWCQNLFCTLNLISLEPLVT